MGVGAGWAFAQHLTFGNLRNKEHMATHIQLLDHLASKHCIGVFRQIQQAVAASFYRLEVGKFICIPTGLHTEMANGLKGNILCQHTDIKCAGVFNHLPCQVVLLAGDGHSVGVFRDLNGRIGNAAVILAQFPGA